MFKQAGLWVALLVVTLQSSLAIAEIPAVPSATFRISHKVSDFDLTVAYNGERDDKRNVTVWPRQNTGDDKSFRWYFDSVQIPSTDELQSANNPSGYFYIHNLKTGLVLTQDPDDNNVSTWGRTEGDYNQHWRLSINHADGSVMIYNRGRQNALTQAYGGSDTDKRNVTTFPGAEPTTGAFTWKLSPAGDVELTKLWLEEVLCINPSSGTDFATTALFAIIDFAAFTLVGGGALGPAYEGVALAAGMAEVLTVGAGQIVEATNEEETEGGLPFPASELAFAIAQKYSGEDDLLVKINGRKIWPNGNSEPIESQESVRLNRYYIHEKSLGAIIELKEYDYGSDDDTLGSVAFTDNDTSYYRTVFSSSDEKSLFNVSVTTVPFRAYDPTRPMDIALNIESKQGFSLGSVEVSPQSDDGIYPRGSELTLTANPTDKAEFVRWEGTSNNIDLLSSDCGYNIQCELVTAVDTIIKPIFRSKPTLVVENLYAGNTVTYSPAGIPCITGSTACNYYSTGDNVTITAIPGDSDRVFDYWEGDADCQDGNVTMTKALICNPVFKRVSYSFSINTPSEVTVTSNPEGISCGTSCENDYLVSEGVQRILLTAEVPEDWTFIGWAGSYDCRDEDENDGKKYTARVDVGGKDINCSVIAYSSGTQFALSVVNSGGGGVVTAVTQSNADSSGIDCGLDTCSQLYSVNTEVQLTVIAARGSKFYGFETRIGNTTYRGTDAENVCADGQITMTEDISCLAFFTSSVLVVDGSDDLVPKESNEIMSSINYHGSVDADIWSVRSPSQTSNPGGRSEPTAEDLANYGRVIWYTNTTNDDDGWIPAGPSPAAEAHLAEYLDNGGCLIMSSPEYIKDRGLTDFAKNYLGVSSVVEDVAEDAVSSIAFSNYGYKLENSVNPFGFQRTRLGDLADSVNHNPDILGSSAIFEYAESGMEAGVSMNNNVYRSIFMGFPLLGMSSGNTQHAFIKSFFDFCSLPEQDDKFEPNNSLEQTVELKDFVSQENLKRMPGNDDYFHWTASGSAFTLAASTTFSIVFDENVGDLSLEVYDSASSLVGSSTSQRGLEDIYITDVNKGDSYYIRVFGVNDKPVPYTLNIADDGDRDHDGMFDSRDALPDDPNEQYDTDQDLIGNNADTDDDGDGLPDDYEITHGLDPLVNSADGDEDLDNFKNLVEYNYNTDPTDSNSYPDADPEVEPEVDPNTEDETSSGGGSLSIGFLFIMLLLITRQQLVRLKKLN